MSSPLERFSDYSRGSKRETAEAVRGSEVHFYEEQVMNDSADGEGDEKMSVCPEDESNTVYGRGESSSHSSYSVPRSTRLVSTSAKSIKVRTCISPSLFPRISGFIISLLSALYS